MYRRNSQDLQLARAAARAFFYVGSSFALIVLTAFKMASAVCSSSAISRSPSVVRIERMPNAPLSSSTMPTWISVGTKGRALSLRFICSTYPREAATIAQAIVTFKPAQVCFLYGPRTAGFSDSFASISAMMSAISQSLPVTPAAIAGVMRNVAWMRTKL